MSRLRLPRRPLSLQSHLPEGANQRLFQFAVHSAKDGESLFSRHWGPIPAILDQSGKNIANRQNAHDVRNAVTTEAIRISASVQKLVMMTYRVENFG
jgi:hypothetical protein